jgi:eukaryotic-like serine/threonine-protein kinase
MKRCPTCATSFVRGGKFCPEDGSLLVDTLNTSEANSGNSDDLATIPIGMVDEPETLRSATSSGLLAGDDALIGQVVADRYRIEEVVGRGGMGVVYRARHLLLDRAVALKLLRPQYVDDDRAVARFLREARAMARIEHPNAVHVYDFGVLTGGAYLVMEFVDGDTLRTVLMTDSPLALDHAVDIAEQVCAAVQAAHDQGVLHRDLKPENIMLREGETGTQIKVVDFGLAKIVAALDEDDDGHKSITTTNELFGTPCYMAPEFFESSDIDGRSDVYAIGIILYEMLAGAPPFRGTMQTVIGAHLFKEAPPITLVNADVPPSVDALIRRMLRKDRDERPASAGEVGSLLRASHTAFLTGGEVSLPFDILFDTPAARDDEPSGPLQIDEESEVERENMPTLAPLPDRLRRPARAPEPVVEVPPTDPIRLDAIPVAPQHRRRDTFVRAGVAVGSAVVLVLAFLSFDENSAPSGAAPEPNAPASAVEPSVEPSPDSASTPDSMGPQPAEPDADRSIQPPASEPEDTGRIPERRAAEPPTSSAPASAGSKQRQAAPADTDDKAKAKQQTQPAKNDAKTRKRAWYDPRRWFGKN